MSKRKRTRPSARGMQRRAKHSYDHRKDSGRFGTIFVEDPPFWDCTEDDHEIAIIPFLVDCDKNGPLRFADSTLNEPFDKEELESGDTWDYKIALWVHYDVGVNSDAVVCLRSANQPCPICEERKRLMDEEDLDYMDEDVRALSASKRVFYNILCFDSDKEFDKGIQVWDAPFKSIEAVLSKIATKENRRTGEYEGKPYYQPEEGWNVAFEREGKRFKTKYENIEVLQRREEDDVSDADWDDYFSKAHDLENLIEIKSYADIYYMLHGVEPNGAATPATAAEEKDSRRDKPRGRGGERAATTDSKSDAAADSKSRGRGRRASRKQSRDDNADDDAKESNTNDGDDGNDNDKPDCFGLENDMHDRCEACPDDLYDACLKAYEEFKAVGSKGKTSERAKGKGRRK